MKKSCWTDYINESHEVYHDSYTGAVNAALAYTIKRGFTTDNEEVAHIVGDLSNRPSSGQTTRVSLPIYKNGKLQRKQLHFQVYNRNTTSNTFELNCYIM